MRQGETRSINSLSKYPSLWLLAAAVCLWPAAAQAQGPGSNTAYGDGALFSNTTGSANTAYGEGALFYNTTGRYNTASGAYALYSNIIGGNNTTSGYFALYSNTTGGDNTASGSQALRYNTSGSYNTASGSQALRSNTTGRYNTANGYAALRSNTTGGNNTASGRYALFFNTTGGNNTANGFNALRSNATGSYNTANGYGALTSNTTGSNNVAVGSYALEKINGTYNIALGSGAGARTTAGNYNIYIGHPGINGSENRVMRIGRAQTKTFIDGIAGVPVSGATVVARSNGQLGVVASSARYKQDIRTLDDASGKLWRLRPVSYRYKTEPEATHYGLIAEEVDKVMPELVVRDDQNRPETVQYQELIPLLLQQWKAQQAEIARQRALIERQEAALIELRRTLATGFAARDEVDGAERAGGK